MDQLTQQDLTLHIKVLGWLHILGHTIFLVVGLFIFTLLTGIGAASGEAEAVAILGVIGTAIGFLLAALAIPGLVSGYGLLQHKPWGRVLALVVGVLNLVNFPVGTVIGIYTFWVLLQKSATDYFEQPPAVNSTGKLPV